MLSNHKDKINPREGSITFKISNHHLFTPSSDVITVDRFMVKDTEFLIQREPNMSLIFQHSSPETGTRISKLDLNEVGQAPKHFLAFTWSDKEVVLYMGIDGGRKIVQGKYQKLT